MSDNHVKPDQIDPAPAPTGIDPATVKATIASVMSILANIAAITPTKVDDDIVAFLNTFATQTWFVNLVCSVVNAATPAAKQKVLADMHAHVKANLA